MVLRNYRPHQVYVQVKALDPWVCGLEPMGVPCPHECTTVGLYNTLSWPYMKIIRMRKIMCFASEC